MKLNWPDLTFDPINLWNVPYTRIYEMRPSKHEMWLNICKQLATQSTCVRKGVGCVLLDKYGHVLSTGWNGVAAGRPHCNDQVILELYHSGQQSSEEYYPNACEGAKYDSGEGLGKCRAVHAEQNALLQCPDINAVHTCYTTASPCAEQCTKLLLNTSCQRIIFLEEYSKSGKEMWLEAGREWIHYNG
jgi:dCMP deaminase